MVSEEIVVDGFIRWVLNSWHFRNELLENLEMNGVRIRKRAIDIEIAQNFARKRADVLQILCKFGAQRMQNSAGVRRKN